MLSLHQALSGMGDSTIVELPFVRYRFEFSVTASMMLPEYAGSAIRGAFGRALRRTACMTHQSECKMCPLYRSCPYTRLFETPPPEQHALQKFSQIPSAYVIEPPDWGRKLYEPQEKVAFSLILCGHSLNDLPLVIYSIQKAFERNVGHGRAELESVTALYGQEESCIYTVDSHTVMEHKKTTVVSVPKDDSLSIYLETPMRLQNNGIPLGPEDVTVHAFFSTLLRRISLLLEFQASAPLELDFSSVIHSMDSVQLEKNLRWKDWTRYSTRQNQKMSLGGVVGEMNFQGLTAICKLLLLAGTFSHVGKNASFGLGKYSIQQGQKD